MGLTMFKNRDGVHGPVTGAFYSMTLHQKAPVAVVTAVVTNTTYQFGPVQLPTGAKFQITHATVYCGTVTSDPSISVGTTVTGTQIVGPTNLASGANQLTVKSYTAVATGLISATVVTDTGDSILAPGMSLTLWGYLSAPPSTYASLR